MFTEALKVGDKLAVTRDGRTNLMTVHRIDPPGTLGTAVSAGPRISAHIRPGGYGVSFDYGSIAAGYLHARPLTEEDCEEFIADGSCIHSDHTK